MMNFIFNVKFNFSKIICSLYYWLIPQGPVDSIYLRMRALNRCNHRDYQNLSRNGAATNTVLAYMQSVARNRTKDRPALFIYGLYGNDVCNK